MSEQPELLAIVSATSSVLGESGLLVDVVAPRSAARKRRSAAQVLAAVGPRTAIAVNIVALLAVVLLAVAQPWRTDVMTVATGRPVAAACDVGVECPASPELVRKYRYVLDDYFAGAAKALVATVRRADKRQTVVSTLTTPATQTVRLVVSLQQSAAVSARPSSGVRESDGTTVSWARFVRPDTTVLEVTVISPPGVVPFTPLLLEGLVTDARFSTI